MIPIQPAKTAAAILIGVLAGQCATFFLMWRSEVNDFAKYRAEFVAAGKVQEAEVVRITTEQKQITEDTTNAWKAALDLTRSQYATAGRVRQPSGSCQMPGVSQPAIRVDGAGKDTVSSSGAVEEVCAETTVTLNFLQDWIERQQKASQ
jgi:hypothetical protein